MTRRSLLTLAVALLAARTAFAGWREEAKKLPPLDENDPKNFDNPYTVLGLDETSLLPRPTDRIPRFALVSARQERDKYGQMQTVPFLFTNFDVPAASQYRSSSDAPAWVATAATAAATLCAALPAP